MRKEVLELRARLSELQDDQWVKASYIMQEITSLLGHNYGPMGGKIEPRACRYCHYYGHTRQWCPKLKEREEREYARILAEDQALGHHAEEEELTEWQSGVVARTRHTKSFWQ